MDALRDIGSIFNSVLTLLIPKSKNEQEKNELLKQVESLKELLNKNFSKINIKESSQNEKNINDAIMLAIEEEKVDLIALLIGAKHHGGKPGKNVKYIQSVITNNHNLPVLCQ
jgi:hypothetical protein